ncbi:MAG: hypothetical protein MSC30_19670 [Gaiellaceae bacterium MAG52_C11]|nr:hypothetical protein [Candidatus Gaiellasilicea maunaloa]
MATTVYYCASSLDGYIAEADDSLDWLLNYQGTVEHEAAEPGPMSEGGSYEGFYEGVRALVSGSATYEWILDHLDVAGGGEWPYRGKPCWVLSSRELRLPEGEGVDVRIVDASVGELHGEMAAAAGDGVLWVVGGGNVASQFADEGSDRRGARDRGPHRAGRRQTALRPPTPERSDAANRDAHLQERHGGAPLRGPTLGLGSTSIAFAAVN